MDWYKRRRRAEIASALIDEILVFPDSMTQEGGHVLFFFKFIASPLFKTEFEVKGSFAQEIVKQSGRSLVI